MGDLALFKLRHWHRKAYNIFALGDGTFEGRVFDQYRRVFYKTEPRETVDSAILLTRQMCEQYAKGQCITGIRVDAGKEIREKEEREYKEMKKNQRKKA